MKGVNLDSHKHVWLKSLGLAEDMCIIDCDPVAQTVMFDDGRIRQVTETWTRVMGYHRPISSWNKGKQSEHNERCYFQENQIAT